MKNTTNQIRLLVFLFATLFFSQNKLHAQAHDPIRGFYIDGFATINSNDSLVPAFSILNQSAKEDSLLKYCLENHITYIILYNLSQVLDNDTSNNSYRETALCNFMHKAKTTYGITKIGAIVSSVNGVRRDSTFQFRQMHPTPAFKFTNKEKTSSAYNKLKFVETAYQQGDSLFEVSELTKAALNISHFNKVAATCSSPNVDKFDVINIELEFWNQTTPTQYNTTEKAVLDAMAHLRFLNDSIFPTSPILTEIYLGYLNKFTTPDSSVIAHYLDGQLYSNNDTIKLGTTNHRLLDRFLLAYYSSDPATSYYPNTSVRYINRLRTLDRNTTLPQTNTIPLFSAATIALGYEGDFFGKWFPQSNRNNIFVAEKEWYIDWLADVNHPTVPEKNITEPAQSVWYTSSIMASEITSAKIKHTNTFYSDSPVNTYGATSATATFTYIGPIEQNVIIHFKLDSAGTTLYTKDTVTVNSTTSVYIPHLGSKNLKPYTYTGILQLDYGNGHTYTYKEPVIVYNGLKAQAMGNTTFCDGGGVILKSGKRQGSPTVMRYHWFKDSIPLYNDSSSAYYYATRTGNYYCRVDSTNASGIAHKYSNTISVTALTNNPASITETTLTGGAGRTLIPHGSTPSGTTYAWSTGATSQNIVITDYGQYDVLITQPNGCFRSASFDVNEIICDAKYFDKEIKTNYDTLAANSFSGITSFNSGDSLIVRKNLHFNKNFRFNNSYVICAAGVRIVVDSSFTLTIVNGTQINKCNDLWKGIEVRHGGTLKIDSSSVIKGAIQAVYSTKGGVVQIKNSTFDNNYKSIYLANANYSTSTITGNHFNCSGAKTLPPPYYNQRTWAQIHILNVHGDTTAPLGLTIGGFSSGSKNFFSNSDFGIVASESSFDAYNNDFSNIFLDTISEDGGIAIIATSPEYTSYEMHRYPINIGTTGSNSANIFHNCYQGVSCSGHQSAISGNYFTDVKYGIAVLPNVHWSTDINYNRITNTDIGIDVYGLHDEVVNIDHNKRIVVNAAANSYEMTAAIRVLNFGVSRANIIIQNNDSILSSGTYGILAINEEEAQLTQNKVYLNQNSASSLVYGMRLENCFGATVNCNFVRGNARAYIANKNAISLTMSSNGIIDNNTTTNSSKGLEFLSDCDNSIIRGNSMRYHKYGFTLGAEFNGGTSWSSGIIGNQDTLQGKTLGNRFEGQDSAGAFTNGSAMLSINSDAAAKRFWVDNTYYPPLTFDTLRVGNYSGFISKFSASSPPGISHYTIPLSCVYLMKPPKGGGLEECCIEECCTGEEGGEGGEQERVMNNSRERNKYEDLTQEEASALSEPAQAFVDSMVNTNSGALSDVQIILHELSDSLKSIDSVAYYSKKSSAIARNNSVTNGTIYESNEQQLNALLLSKSEHNKFSFTESEKQFIESIAFQCPYKGGKAVFKARPLVYLWNRNIKFDDDLLCEGGASFRKASTNKKVGVAQDNNFQIYPNPATNEFFVKYDFTKYNTAVINITDVLGRVVYSQNLNCKQYFARGDISNLSSSVYFVKIVADNKTIQQTKITTIK